jgi:immune inhibitor A
MRRSLILVAVLALLAAASPVAGQQPPEVGHDRAAQRSRSDNFDTALSKKQKALKQKAHEMVLAGKAKALGQNKVVEVARGQFVELAFEGEDQILTLLGEFGDEPATHNHGQFGTIDHGGDPGPLHNQIPEPDRDVDNTTIWTEDFSQAHYDELLYSKSTFPSMANWYLEQSSGRYSVNGYVGDWVQVNNNGAAYGSNYCGSIVCGPDTWRFVQESANGWFDSLLASMTAQEIEDFLAPFDVWDRYDHDGDGNFDEPDGYIDHFQSVHAGAGEETGGGVLGSDAIWSHRWYVQLTPIGAGGPTVGGDLVPFGGTQIGSSSKWIGDYTIEPENGGVGVFAHEFGHDLGLPDLYDLSGNVGGAENSTGFWTIMSSGSYGSQNGIDIGSAPVHFGAWEKFQLGWLDYDVAFAGARSTHRLGPAATQTKKAQGLFVVLPDKEVEVNLGEPFEGEQYYYSDAGNDLNNFMTREVTLPAAGDLELDAQVRYSIEVDWDYAYLVVSTDGGASWNGVETNRSTSSNPNGQNFGNGITGSSGGDWVPLTADLSAWAGQTVLLGFRYWTDGFVVESGFQVDALEIPGQDFDGAETDAGWSFDGFVVTSGTGTEFHFNAYVVEFRTYRGYDKSLDTGPYNFGWLNEPDLVNLVEHFSYQDGVLISYWDSSFEDNNVGDHPGGGLILPVDSHPELEHWSDGTLMRPRLQTYDSVFGLSPTESITPHNDGVPTTIASKPAVPLFDDSNTYWFDCDEHGCTGDHPGRYQPGWSSVNVPNTGTRIRVVSVGAQGNFVQVNVD